MQEGKDSRRKGGKEREERRRDWRMGRNRTNVNVLFRNNGMIT